MSGMVNRIALFSPLTETLLDSAKIYDKVLFFLQIFLIIGSLSTD